jgi:SAM-dependent methyltransferase
MLKPSDVDHRTVLEIGCGRGGFSDYLIRQYPQIGKLYASDYSESALQIGRRRSGGLAKIVWQQEDVQNLSFGDQTFNTIVSCETIEHVPHPLRALAEMYRVLKPGGRVILTCPNYFNLFGIWCLYRKLIGKPYTEGGQPYVNYLLIPSIYGKIKMLGFTIEHFHSSELVLPARVPKTFYQAETPVWVRFFGSRTFYVLRKPLFS